MPTERIHTFEAYLTRNTDKAVCMTIHNEAFWIPMSQIVNVEDCFNSDSSLKVGNTEVTLTDWIVREKGLK